MLVEELNETHELYKANVDEWQFLQASYEGTKELVKCGYLQRNERESIRNYNRRLQEAFGFSYSKSVVDLFNFYLFKKPVKRSLGSLQTDTAWDMFQNDCNLYGDNFDHFMMEQGRYSSIEGAMGILVDKTTRPFENRAEELENEVYPYVSSYFPTAILDWRYERDENNRPELTYLKLRDDIDVVEIDGVVQRYQYQYILWWKDHFQVYVEPYTSDGVANEQAEAVLLIEGDNPLGVIPFVWLYNMKSKRRPIGVSDIHDVARIDVSILRNLSQGEEVINYGAFPMMRKPMQEVPASGGRPQQDDEVGIVAILEFDPAHPESKPDWLEAMVAEPITAILDWIERKVSEIYRSVNAGGMASMEISTAPKSGSALKAEFQLLNSKLVRKAINLEKAEQQVIEYWLMWQNQDDLFDGVKIERSRTYDVENLAADLENSLTSITIVNSKLFKGAIQKNVARQMLPAFTDEQMDDIDKEIEANIDKPLFPTAGGGEPDEGGETEEEEEE